VTGKTINWGIIGLGKIAHKFVEDLIKVPNTKLYAVASRSSIKSAEFAERFNAEIAYDNYEAIVNDTNIDAIYIATPHSFHCEQTILCLNSGKAVLCEKPLALNSEEVEKMISTATSNQILLMEALWTYFLPHYQKALEIIKTGVLGEITELKADFGFKPVYDESSRVFNKSLGGGSLLDIGIYPIFAALSILGMPENISAKAQFFQNGTDSKCDILFNYHNGITATLKSTFLEETPTEAIITGTKGVLKLNSRFHAPTSLSLKLLGKPEQIIEFDVPYNGYYYEIGHFNKLLNSNQTESNVMSFEMSRNLITLLDWVKNEIGLVYKRT
jgi:predicted dehydrogenase